MPLKYIDSLLNQITMYKLVLFGLAALATLSVLFGFVKILPFSGLSFMSLLILLLAVCYVTQKICDKLFHSVSNTESYAITALILFFVLSPLLSFEDFLISAVVGVVAILSKYILAIDKKHIFNPAAIAVFFVGLFGFGNAIWWVGSGVLLPFTLVLGLLIVRKIRRFDLLFPFLLTAALVNITLNLFNGLTLEQAVSMLFLSSSLIFFGTVMLTEPLTTPPRKTLYMTYGALVGVFFGAQFHIGPFFASPELALVIGNIFSYIVSPKHKLFLRLKERIQLSPDMFSFVFTKPNSFTFLPGQYLEWTVPHQGVDMRGNRRYFTIASSPTESEIILGVKITPNGSSYKKALLNLSESALVVGSQLSGDFVLPEDTAKKLVFIAGGIGVTPFRSMIRYLIDTQNKRDIVLLYTAPSEAAFVYKDVFEKAREYGMNTIYIITNEKNIPPSWSGGKGYLTEEFVRSTVPDFASRLYFLSGPNNMVESYKSLLRRMGISYRHIVTDYFPGF